MERKKLHRILGALVAISLVIMLIPFLQENKSFKEQTALLKQPEFPAEPSQLASVESSNIISTEPQLTESSESAPQISAQANDKHADLAAEVEKTLTKIASNENSNNPVSAPAANETLKPWKLDKSWAIQLGSFRHKTNALKLVNELRAKGFHAFLQQVPNKANVRVLVGPENKKVNATQLASRIKKELQMKGIIINYQPLAI